MKRREVWGIRVQSGPSPGILCVFIREWGGLIIDDKSVCSEIFQCESLFYGGDYVTTLRVQSIYAGGVQSVCLYLRNISNIAYHLSCTVYCDRRGMTCWLLSVGVRRESVGRYLGWGPVVGRDGETKRDFLFLSIIICCCISFKWIIMILYMYTIQYTIHWMSRELWKPMYKQILSRDWDSFFTRLTLFSFSQLKNRWESAGLGQYHWESLFLLLRLLVVLCTVYCVVL